MEANDNDHLLIIKDNEAHKSSKPASNHTYLQAATNQNTRRAYQADIRHFISWGGRLPSSPDVFLRYLQEHATNLNSRTLKRRLVAIKHWHTC